MDINEAAEGHPLAMKELAELRLAHERYETARKLSPAQWLYIWEINISLGKPFDEIIDDLGKFYSSRKLSLN